MHVRVYLVGWDTEAQI
uniref:Uncharacterized protein n=1 Tax=Arundo donax TaxID=35708 RepID=A0A0A9CH88_ARUDO